MVRVIPHGGSCCGARHLVGFDGTNDSVDSINTAALAVPVGRMTEVILNHRQVTTFPNTIQRLADLGFVLVGRYQNDNHVRDNFVFHRCDKRRPLNNLPFTWPGMIISPTLTGDLPVIPSPTPRGAVQVDPTRPIEFEDGTPAVVHHVEAGTRVYLRLTNDTLPTAPAGRTVPIPSMFDGNHYWDLTTGQYGGDPRRIHIRNVVPAFQLGARVQITNRDSSNFNRSGVVTNLNAGGYIEVNLDGRSLRFNSTSLRVITGVNEAPAVPVADTVAPQRHTNATEPAAARAVAPVEVRVIYHTFHNRYTDGRIGAGYPSLADAERAAPRCRTRLRRDISSDGTVNDVALQV